MNLYLLTVEDLQHKFYVLATNSTDAEKILIDSLHSYYSDNYNVLNIQLLAKSSINDNYMLINNLYNLFITDKVIITPKIK